MKRSRVRPLEWLLIVVFALVIVAVLFPTFPDGGRKTAASSACLSNVKRLALGMAFYASDHDDRFPRRDFWMDAIVPAVRELKLTARTEEPGLFRCPKIVAGGYGYAFDSRLDRVKPESIEFIAEATMLFDSVNPIRNASDPFVSLPAVPRHWHRNNVAYADGHAKGIYAPVVK